MPQGGASYRSLLGCLNNPHFEKIRSAHARYLCAPDARVRGYVGRDDKLAKRETIARLRDYATISLSHSAGCRRAAWPLAAGVGTGQETRKAIFDSLRRDCSLIEERPGSEQ